MKKIFIFLVLIGPIKVAASLAAHRAPANIITTINDLESTETPVFRNINGNLFMVLDIDGAVRLVDGDVIEFYITKDKKIVSFQVNSTNPEILSTNSGDVVSYIHNDLVIALRDERIREVRITTGSEVYKIRVNKQWRPEEYLLTKVLG